MTSLPEHLAAVPAGRHPLDRGVIDAHQREHIVKAAAPVFAKRGYANTTVDHIVDAARVGVGSFYELFDGGKEHCFLFAFDRVTTMARESIAAAVPVEGSWAEQACAVVGSLLGLIAAEPTSAKLVLVEAPNATPATEARYDELIAEFRAPLLRGREESELAAQLPASAEDAILGGLAWLLQQRLMLGEVDQIEEIFPELARVVLEPYLGGLPEVERVIAAATADA